MLAEKYFPAQEGHGPSRRENMFFLRTLVDAVRPCNLVPVWDVKPQRLPFSLPRLPSVKVKQQGNPTTPFKQIGCSI